MKSLLTILFLVSAYGCGGIFNISGGPASGVFSGYENTVAAGASVITGGAGNIICSLANFGFIGTGDGNGITTSSRYGFIGNGLNNCIGNAVAGCNPASYGVIAGGILNCIDATTLSTYYGFIGNGRVNKICAGAYFSSVVGGYCNTVASNHASIVGGCNNTVSGALSSILGGSGNTIAAAYPYAGIFGCNITAVSGCVFHANNFAAPNIPSAAPASARTFYINVVGGVCYVAIT